MIQFCLGSKICFHKHVNMMCIPNIPICTSSSYVSGIRDEFLFNKASVSVTMMFPHFSNSCFGRFHHLQTHKMHAEMPSFCRLSLRLISTKPLPLPSGGSNDGGGVLSNFSSFRPRDGSEWMEYMSCWWCHTKQMWTYKMVSSVAATLMLMMMTTIL